MDWKIKAAIQNLIALLPDAISYEAYYWVQRRFGALRRVNPVSRLVAGIETCKRIQKHGRSPAGRVFLEVGTGRAPLVPLAYWLMGAESTITIDLNPYLKEELVADHLRYISDNEDEIARLFGPLLDGKRFEEVLTFARGPKQSVSEFLDLCRITYIAPGDAANTGLPDESIDFHTSYTVFEHIPPSILEKILREGNRITKASGLFVHYIDYSDHFSHSDKNISAINFLAYSDRAWARYAGNRYMYANRLRHDDFLSLFESVGQRVLGTDPVIDQNVQKILAAGKLRLNERFQTKSNDILATTAAWIVTEKSR